VVISHLFIILRNNIFLVNNMPKSSLNIFLDTVIIFMITIDYFHKYY
jgi:hypothetical protein